MGSITWLRLTPLPGLLPGLLLGLLLPAAVSAGEGAVLRGSPTVIDGNTLELEGRRLTLYGIDAPELGQECGLLGRRYDCGDISRAALLDLTAGAEIECRVSAASAGAAECFADDYDLGAGMVYTGWALADRGVTQRYAKIQARAEAAKRGLWRGRFVPPWEWRAGKRLEKTAEAAE